VFPSLIFKPSLSPRPGQCFTGCSLAVSLALFSLEVILLAAAPARFGSF